MAQLTVYSFDQGSENDYFQQVLHLALEKTRASHGDYTLAFRPELTYRRALATMQSAEYQNSVISLTTSPLERNRYGVDAVEFPLIRGLLGYRICYIAPNRVGSVDRNTPIESLQQIPQGVASIWVDANIFRHNGFQMVTVEGSNSEAIDSLYNMVANNRVGLFCRGIAEIGLEKQRYDHLDGLHPEESIAFYYDMPFFFHVPAGNFPLQNRIREGLETALRDDSFVRLWKRHYQSTVEETRLTKRKIHVLENPQMTTVNKKYRRYLYRPDY